MKKLLVLLVIVSACSKETVTTSNCAIEATVRDLTGLDGCGFVFELNDGTRLEPQILMYCGTMPLAPEITNDPLYNFQFVDGKRVKISYEQVEGASICMVGPRVKITCLTELSVPETNY
ncbi:MAG: hypothetical protein HOP30_03615 [Cyclobacteriaceae bacterium]|nr:hypothetical protein [Cyclobacteriaceae bacterium]